MPKWVEINPNTLDIATHKRGQFQGVEIVEGLSPDEIPEKIRAVSTDDGWIIYLSYVSDFTEPRLVLGRLGPVKPVVGRHSGRLYELRIPHERTPQQIPQEVEHAINALTADKRFVNCWRHYKVAGEAISENADAILPQTR